MAQMREREAFWFPSVQSLLFRVIRVLEEVLVANTLQMGLIGCGGIMGVHIEGLKQLWERG